MTKESRHDHGVPFSMHPALDPHEQQARADYIHRLYINSGRTNGLYTGLYQERIRYLVAIDQAEHAAASSSSK
jgi:hypothetical protein